jgi:hypothetical protein
MGGERALNALCAVVQEKTENSWAHRDQFVKKPGKYGFPQPTHNTRISFSVRVRVRVRVRPIRALSSIR